MSSAGACPVLQYDPIKDSEELYALSVKLAKLGASKDERANGEQSIRTASNPSSAEDVFQLARRLHTRLPLRWASEARAVEVLYRKALSLSPGHVGALCNYGTLQQHSFYNISASRMLYESAEALNASNIVVQHSLALLAQTSGQLQEAEVRFKRVLACEPKHVPSLFFYAGFLAEHRHDFEQAESLYRRAIENDPHNIEMLCTIATFFRTTDQVSESRRILEQALRLAPQHPRVLATCRLLNTADTHGDGLAAEGPTATAAHGRVGVRKPEQGAPDVNVAKPTQRAAAASAAGKAGLKVDAGDASVEHSTRRHGGWLSSQELIKTNEDDAADREEGPEAPALRT